MIGERTNVTRAVVVCVNVRELGYFHVFAITCCLIPVTLGVFRPFGLKGMCVLFSAAHYETIAGCESAHSNYKAEKEYKYSFHNKEPPF